MDFKQIKINGEDILEEGIIYTQVNWRKLAVSDSSRNIEGLHSRVVSPTYARYRIITIEGIIDRIDLLNKTEERLNKLQRIFALQTQMGGVEEKEVYVKDIFDNEWKIKAKIKDPFEFIEGDDNIPGSHWSWRVVLESTLSPLYFSYEEKENISKKGNYGGFHLGMKLGSKFNLYNGIFQVSTLNAQTYTRFELNAKETIKGPIVIKNITTDEFFKLNVDLENGDVVIIDSENFSVLKNGINIINKRVVGSSWLKISGKNMFVLLDSLGNIYSKELEVKIYFSNAML